MLGWVLYQMCRWTPTRMFVMRLMGLTAGCFFPMLMLWPSESDQVRVMIWATDDFSLKSCLSSWNAADDEAEDLDAVEPISDAIN